VDLAALWYGEAPSARAGRAALAPLEAAWRGAVAARNRLFDRGVLRSAEPALPALSVGNLSVGGTGKTPVAAHVARALRGLGAAPAIVMRGYGDDEPRVHALLNPDVPVFAGSDRLAGARSAREAGCDVVVLDDAFQHRGVRRVVDLVLVAAEQWTHAPRSLPSGPYREPPASLKRASMVLVTRKSTDASRAREVQDELRRYTQAPVGIAALRLDALRGGSGGVETLPLSSLQGARVLAVAGVGAPRAFARQLEGERGIVTLAAFPDHHPFSARDASALARRAAEVDFVVCTLKDAVKLAPLWPRAAPSLWYVSQRIDLEDGARQLDDELRRLLDARHAAPTPTTG
jgi:tetraacyldisaccharide 4'-kinase